MDYSVAGLIGGAVALGAGFAAYIALIPSVQQRLISIAPTETAAQREDLAFKLGVMRRLILTLDIVVFGLVGYVAGQAIGG